MRIVKAVALLALSAPFWALGLAASPFWFVERVCYRICSTALMGFLAAMRSRDRIVVPPGSTQDLLAKQRAYRRHRNHRRPVLP